jgi:hypothetical protein
MAPGVVWHPLRHIEYLPQAACASCAVQIRGLRVVHSSGRFMGDGHCVPKLAKPHLSSDDHPAVEWSVMMGCVCCCVHTYWIVPKLGRHFTRRHSRVGRGCRLAAAPRHDHAGEPATNTQMVQSFAVSTMLLPRGRQLAHETLRGYPAKYQLKYPRSRLRSQTVATCKLATQHLFLVVALTFASAHKRCSVNARMLLDVKQMDAVCVVILTSACQNCCR